MKFGKNDILSIHIVLREVKSFKYQFFSKWLGPFKGIGLSEKLKGDTIPVDVVDPTEKKH